MIVSFWSDQRLDECLRKDPNMEAVVFVYLREPAVLQ